MRKSLIIVTPAVCIAAIVLRILQLFYGTENGFYIKNHYSVLPLTLLAVAAALYCFAVMFFTRRQPRFETSSPRPSGILLFAAAFAFGFDAFQKMFEIIFTDKAAISVFPLILSVLELISAIVFVVFSCQIIMRFDFKYERSLLLAIVPLFWMLLKLAYEFLGYTTVANISGHFYHVLMTSSTLLFVLYYFKASARGFAVSAGTVIGFTLPVCLFSCIAVIPTAVNSIRNGESILESVSGFDIGCLMIAVFAYMTAYKLVFSKADRLVLNGEEQ